MGVGSVVAAIEGGDRVESVQDELQLDASTSFDEDINADCGDGAGDWRANIGRRRLAHKDAHEARAAGDCGTGDDAGLSFSWICEELEVLADGKMKLVSGSCATDTEPFPTGVWALKSVEQRLIFLGEWLGTGNYRFTVTAASADARNSTTSVDIELINEEPSKVVVSNFARKVNAAEKQTILGLVTPPDGVTIDDLTTTWTRHKKISTSSSILAASAEGAWKLRRIWRPWDCEAVSSYPCPCFFRRHMLEQFVQARKLFGLPHLRPWCILFRSRAHQQLGLHHQ